MGSIAAGAMQASATDRQTDMQVDENAKNREWQTSEREASQQFSVEQLEREQSYQSEEWSRQFEAQNAEYDRRLADERAYNSPAAQAARLRQAGINSAVMAFGNSVGSDSTFGLPSSPSVSSPSGAVPTAPSASTSPLPSPANMSAVANVIGEIGSFARDLSQAGLNKEQSNRIATLLSGEAEGLLLRNHGHQILNSIKQTEDEILSKTKDVSVRKAYQELLHIQTDIFLKGTQSEYYGSNALLLAEERLLTMSKRRFNDMDYHRLVFDVKNQQMMFNTQMKLMNAQTSDFAQGARLKSFQADLEKIEANLADDTKLYKLLAIVGDYKAQASEADQRDLAAQLNSLETAIQLEVKSKHPNYVRLRAAINELKDIAPNVNLFVGKNMK